MKIETTSADTLWRSIPNIRHDRQYPAVSMVFVRDEDVWDPVWPDVEGLVIDAVDVVGDVVWIDLHGRQQTVACPSCDAAASHVHSTLWKFT
ncbi:MULTISPECIES: hypothetical protein [Streptomyces]|uniref:Uncharacterized protein n=1 Tax=Streptomyces eurythermus TaxID=42237 RepID=A0ABW6Z6Z6_9ACTN|nr:MULTISPECIES: hypothetical protein [Streptomyces]QIS74971.1 hypothetical protein HB370_37465 [Streptomyces sp. DSM 40868]